MVMHAIEKTPEQEQRYQEIMQRKKDAWDAQQRPRRLPRRSKERELDLPFLLLLPALGFHDVHLTHGAIEFGTDFIAKKREDGREVQYAFQSKAGDIDLRKWRNDVRGSSNPRTAGLIHTSTTDLIDKSFS